VGNGWGQQLTTNITPLARTTPRIEGNTWWIAAKRKIFGAGVIPPRDCVPRGSGPGPDDASKRIQRRAARPLARFLDARDNFDLGRLADLGEIDLMENIGAGLGVPFTARSRPRVIPAPMLGAPYTLPGGSAFDRCFSHFAIEWSTNLHPRVPLMAQQYFSVGPPRLCLMGATWVFTAPQFLLLNVSSVAIGPPFRMDQPPSHTG